MALFRTNCQQATMKAGKPVKGLLPHQAIDGSNWNHKSAGDKKKTYKNLDMF